MSKKTENAKQRHVPYKAFKLAISIREQVKEN